MSYGDYDGPDKPNKGHEGGACNRQRCHAEPAIWYNHGSHSWYCADCKRDIGDDVVNARNWPRDFPRLFPDRPLHPMFETREQMTARAAFEEQAKAGPIYGENYGDRSVKRSHRGEGRNYVD